MPFSQRLVAPKLSSLSKTFGNTPCRLSKPSLLTLPIERSRLKRPRRAGRHSRNIPTRLRQTYRRRVISSTLFPNLTCQFLGESQLESRDHYQLRRRVLFSPTSAGHYSRDLLESHPRRYLIFPRLNGANLSWRCYRYTSRDVCVQVLTLPRLE